jgi:hypothetical protein
MRIVHDADRYWIDVRGVRSLELGERPPGAGHPR